MAKAKKQHSKTKRRIKKVLFDKAHPADRNGSVATTDAQRKKYARALRRKREEGNYF
jgi:hypothetical protein